MEVFFADDSSQNAKRAGMGKVVSFGGILINEDSIKPLEEAVDSIAEIFHIPPGTELKWSPGKENWIYSNLTGKNREDCYRQILRTAGDFGARVLVTSWATGLSTLQGNDAFKRCLTYVFERLTILLSKEGKNGIIVGDRPGGGRSEEDQLLALFLSQVQLGTEFVLPERVLMNILTAPSHMIRHLQIADLVTGITTAMVGGGYDYAPPVFDEIRPLFVKSSYSLIGGTGLKIAPDRLENLYHWILKEEKYSLPNAGPFLTIPDPNRYYCNNEFEL